MNSGIIWGCRAVLNQTRAAPDGIPWGDETLPRVIHSYQLCSHEANTFQPCSCTGVGGRKGTEWSPSAFPFSEGVSYPELHTRGCTSRAAAEQGGCRGCWSCQITQTTQKSPILPFSSLFLWVLPLLSKRMPCKQLSSSGLFMVSVGKAETDGSTSSGFAFTMELMDGFLDDAHTVAHQWLTTNENSNQSCTWGEKNPLNLHYYVQWVGL